MAVRTPLRFKNSLLLLSASPQFFNSPVSSSSSSSLLTAATAGPAGAAGAATRSADKNIRPSPPPPRDPLFSFSPRTWPVAAIPRTRLRPPGVLYYFPSHGRAPSHPPRPARSLPLDPPPALLLHLPAPRRVVGVALTPPHSSQSHPPCSHLLWPCRITARSEGAIEGVSGWST